MANPDRHLGSGEMLGLEGANVTEFDPDTPHPMVALIEKTRVKTTGGTMRLGAYPAQLPGSMVQRLYEQEQITERHRYRYEVNSSIANSSKAGGICLSGLLPDGDLVELSKFLIILSLLPLKPIMSTSPDPMILIL